MYGPTFYTNLHTHLARLLFGTVVAEKFRVDIDDSTVRYYSGNIFFIFKFYFGDTNACNLVSVVVRVIAVKGIVCVCEDGVKLNYFHSIMNQKEPYTDYVENKDKHTKEI